VIQKEREGIWGVGVLTWHVQTGIGDVDRLEAIFGDGGRVDKSHKAHEEAEGGLEELHFYASPRECRKVVLDQRVLMLSGEWGGVRE
jgi:hypothetical protein